MKNVWAAVVVFGVAALVAVSMAGLFGVITAEDLVRLYRQYPVRQAVAILATAVGTILILYIVAQRQRDKAKELAARQRRYYGLLVLVLLAFFAAGCAASYPQQDPRPPVIFTPPRESPAPEVPLPPKKAESQNPCGILKPIVDFVGGDGPKGVYNASMPIQIQFDVNDWVRCAGGVVVRDYAAPIKFEWYTEERSVNRSVFGAYNDGSVGGFIASRVVGAFGAVLSGISVNGYSPATTDTVQVVRVWYIMTATNAVRQQQLAFQGEGTVRYSCSSYYSDCVDRTSAYRVAARYALINMH